MLCSYDLSVALLIEFILVLMAAVFSDISVSSSNQPLDKVEFMNQGDQLLGAGKSFILFL